MKIDLNIYENRVKWVLWSKWLKWIEDIPYGDEGSFVPYPLQLANAIRIMSNDAVFIFDEVGCGKTISAGIMAKTYMDSCAENGDSKVLVITTSSVKDNKQFEEDWNKIALNFKPVVYNNRTGSDLRFLSKDKKWRMVIIDEAHEFNNTERKYFDILCNELRADKVVFLTATPLRSGGDFGFYHKLAKCILGKQDEEFAFPLEVLNKGDEEDSLICAAFDPYCPVTRYFKDTVRYLDVHEKKEKVHRVIPELWGVRYGLNETREDVLISNIKRKMECDASNRFIVFVSRKAEASDLDNKMREAGITSISTVFADEKWKLKEYSVVSSNLPSVLILNYQIGEAGVNLPGYNHVVHWHISSDPAKLEQRYGRIDRMTSFYPEIYSCFVIPKDYDSNFRNLITAVDYTMGDLLTTLPARNVILTKETLELYKSVFERKRETIEKELEELTKCVSVLTDDKRSSTEKDEILLRNYKDYEKSVPASDEEAEIIQKCIERFIDRINLKGEMKEEMKAEELREAIIGLSGNRIRTLNKKLQKDNTSDADPFLAVIDYISDNSDKIFYSTERFDPGALQTISAQVTEDKSGCAYYIENNKDYQILHEIVRIKDAIRLVRTYADEDLQFASDIFYKLGDAWGFTDSLPSKEEFAYRYKR